MRITLDGYSENRDEYSRNSFKHSDTYIPADLSFPVNKDDLFDKPLELEALSGWWSYCQTQVYQYNSHTKYASTLNRRAYSARTSRH
jgi:hypothetical protein